MNTRRAFALPDALALAVIAVAVVVYLLIASSNQRRLARLSDDVAHLKQIAAATAAYGADNTDQFWTFSWRAGTAPIDPSDPNAAGLTTAADDLTAAAHQAVYIFRTRGGRSNFPVISGWIPHLLYSHLVLEDYLAHTIPWRTFVSSADRERLKWASDPACFFTGCFLPCQPNPSDPTTWRWPYSSSFQVPTCFYDLAPVGTRISQQGHAFNLYFYFNGPLGATHLSSILYPSQKVMLHDQNARHFGSRQPYCTHPEARLPLLFADGGVSTRNAANANPGWDPNSTSTTQYTSMSYTNGGTRCWDPEPLTTGGDIVQGKFRYSRQGIGGRDFGGPEIP